ncbi:MAG: type VI secretion system baseplate subunit TssF [Alphaproteobacteria bacterium]|nr:type VI secretion system baseplate subunit TssF [Alphaproteobacteria bacterium]
MDDLLPHYNRELEFLRRESAEFAQRFPKVAGRLRLGGDVIEDPHVARLVESIALLNARIQLKLDDDFPELTESLLNVLYPHYLAPIPAMGIVQMSPSDALGGAYDVPGESEFETEPVGGEPCRFRTTQPVKLWPIEIAAITLSGRPFRAPQVPQARGALAVLHVKLRCTGDRANFTELQPDTLRFFLAGPPAQAMPLYEMLTNRLLAVAVAEGPADARASVLPASAVQPVGFDRGSAILPQPARSFVGYRILTEYFAFPEKFLFVDIVGISARALLGAGRELDLFFYVSETDKELERSLSHDSLKLGCTPAINLFAQRAEPIRLGGTAYEYRVVPDARRPDALEVYSIQAVTASGLDGTEQPFAPFFGLDHAARDQRRFWQSKRRAGARARDNGTEVFLTFVDRDANPATAAASTVSVETLCLNRDLPSRLPFGGGRPRLELLAPTPAVRQIALISPFTPTRRPPLRGGQLWRLLSHLTLRHLSIAGGEDGAEALREILRLYDFSDTPEVRSQIEGVVSVVSQRGLARVSTEGSTAIAHGLDVSLVLDAARFPPGGAYLFGSVMDRFFGLYAAVNAFSRLAVKLQDRPGILRQWPPRTGEKILL